MAKARGNRKASAQKPRRRPRPGGDQHRDPRGRDVAPPRAPLGPAVAVVRSHAAAFRAWLLARHAAHEPADVVDDLERLLGLVGSPAGITDPARLDPEGVGVVLTLLAALGPPPEISRTLLASLSLWLGFLEESGLWRGTAEDLEDARRLLGLPPLDARLPALLEGVDRDPVAEAAAVTALPLLAHVRELLEWLGPGRGPRDDGAAEAAEVDEDADEEVTSALRALREGGSALAHDPAARAWQAGIAAGALAVEGDRVVITETGRVLLDGAPHERAEEERALVMAFLADVRDVGDQGGEPAPASQGLVDDALVTALREGSAPVDDGVRELVGALAQDGLVRLEEDGQRFAVPEAIAVVVVAALMVREQERTLGAGRA